MLTSILSSGIKNESFCEDFQDEISESPIENQSERRSKNMKVIEKGIILCVPYACNIGGTATLTDRAKLVLLNIFKLFHSSQMIFMI